MRKEKELVGKVYLSNMEDSLWPWASHLLNSADAAFLPLTEPSALLCHKLTQRDSNAQFDLMWKRPLKSSLKDPFRRWQPDPGVSPVTRNQPQISAAFWQRSLPRADGISVWVPDSGCSFPSQIGWTTSIWSAAYLRLLKQGLSGLCWHADPRLCVLWSFRTPGQRSTLVTADLSREAWRKKKNKTSWEHLKPKLAC